MKEFVLNYYPEFKCVADKCKHTCCAGWEMNIDEQSLNAYKNESSEFKKTLASGINFKKSKFKADKAGRCAFLNDKGLCEIIINHGEESLCQVCRDHPRFRSFFNDRVETGLGFCCEQATRIILSFDGKIEPLEVSCDKKVEELDFTQKNILEFRNKALNTIQNRSVSINGRIENLLKECRVDFLERDFKKILKTFLSFEKVDKEWSKRLKSIKKTPFKKYTDEKFSIYCEQFLVNALYRHLSDAEDTISVRARAVACVFSWWIIKSIVTLEGVYDDFDSIIDIVRAFSVEVEYSQKNLDRLFFISQKFVKV